MSFDNDRYSDSDLTDDGNSVQNNTTNTSDSTESDNTFLKDTYTNYVSLLGMYGEGSSAQSDPINAKLVKYKCILFENAKKPDYSNLEKMLQSSFPTNDLKSIEEEAIKTFKFKSVSQLKPNIEEPSTEGEKRDLVKIMHAIGASISQPTDNTDRSRSAFKTKIDGMSDIQVALKNSNLKVYAATKATVQLVFGYEKTGSGVQASGRLQIVPSGSLPKASIIISQFLIKDNKIGGLSKKESSSIAKILSNIVDEKITNEEPVDNTSTVPSSDSNKSKEQDETFDEEFNKLNTKTLPTEHQSFGGRRSKRNKKVKGGKTHKASRARKTHRKQKKSKSKSKSKK